MISNLSLSVSMNLYREHIMDAIETTTTIVETVTEATSECPYIAYAFIAAGVALFGYAVYKAYNLRSSNIKED